MKTIEQAATKYAIQTGCHCDKKVFIEGVKWAQRWIPVEEDLPDNCVTRDYNIFNNK